MSHALASVLSPVADIQLKAQHDDNIVGGHSRLLRACKLFKLCSCVLCCNLTCNNTPIVAADQQNRPLSA